jgi:hypothetical protein
MVCGKVSYSSAKLSNKPSSTSPPVALPKVSYWWVFTVLFFNAVSSLWPLGQRSPDLSNYFLVCPSMMYVEKQFKEMVVQGRKVALFVYSFGTGRRCVFHQRSTQKGANNAYCSSD